MPEPEERGVLVAVEHPVREDCTFVQFFYGTTLWQKKIVEHIPPARKADTLPPILSRDQVVPDLEM